MTDFAQRPGSSSAASPSSSDTSDQELPQPLNLFDRVGMGVLALLSLTGLWMIVAPFLVGYQGRGADWPSGTTNDVVVGIVLAVLPLVALVTLFGGALAELARNARRRAARV